MGAEYPCAASFASDIGTGHCILINTAFLDVFHLVSINSDTEQILLLVLFKIFYITYCEIIFLLLNDLMNFEVKTEFVVLD